MKSVYLLLVSSILWLPVCAYSEESTVDEMLEQMEKQLQISKQRYAEMQPELRAALEKKSEELSASYDAALDKGLIELEQMGNRYSEATSEAADKLEALMRSDEVSEMRAYLSQLDEDAIRDARDQMAEEFIVALQLTGEQIEAIKPIITEKLENLGKILEQYRDAGKESLEQFRAEFEAETRKGVKEVESILDPDQVEVFEEQLESISDAVQTEVFEI